MISQDRLRILLARQPGALSQPLVGGHLHAKLAFDVGQHIVSAAVDDLAFLGISSEIAFAKAWSWLHTSTRSDDLREIDTLEGVHVLMVDDGLAASRLTMLDSLYERPPLGGLVAATPTHDQLLCVPLESARSLDALQTLASIVGRAVDSLDDVLCDELFWFDNGVWQPIPVQHGEKITVIPPAGFVATMNQLASMDLVRTAGEA